MDRCSKIQLIISNLEEIKSSINNYLKGRNLANIEQHIRGLEVNNRLPDWFEEISSYGRPKKEDSKSLGTMIEKLIKAELIYRFGWKITGSSAMGVDIPEIDLNIKSTSNKQPQSSEPFKSPYDRVLGAEYDIIIAIYDGLTFLSNKNSNLQIIKLTFLTKTEVADTVLCTMARDLKSLIKENNFSEIMGKRTLRCIVFSKKSGYDFKLLKKALKKHTINDFSDTLSEIEKKLKIEDFSLPTNEEWKKFLTSPLNGKIGISFALQWRYQFKRLLN